MPNQQQKKNREREKKKPFLVFELTLQTTEEAEGHAEGVGEVRWQTECATASADMMIHLGHTRPLTGTVHTRRVAAFRQHFSQKF